MPIDLKKIVQQMLVLKYYYSDQKTGRLKPRLHKQNPPPRVEDREVKIT